MPFLICQEHCSGGLSVLPKLEKWQYNEIRASISLDKLLNENQQDQLQKILVKYAKLFSKIPGEINIMQHDMELMSDKPVRMKPYCVLPTEV